MKPCGYVGSSALPLTIQIAHPFAAPKALSCSFPSLSSLSKLAGRNYASFLWVRVQRRSSKPLHFTVSLLKNDGSYAKNNEDEWYAMDASHVKDLMWGFLQRWGSPAAVGAMVGSIVARKTFVLVLSVSFLALMAMCKAMEVQGLDKASHAPSSQALTNLIYTMRSMLSTIIIYMSGAIMVSFSRSSQFILQFLITMRSLIANTLLALSQRQSKEIVKEPALGSGFKFADTLIADINACIQNVEGMLKTGEKAPPDTNWNQLKEGLSSLKTTVAFLSKGDQHIVPTPDAFEPTTSAPRVSEKKPKSTASIKCKEGNSQQLEVDKVRGVSEDKMFVTMSVDMSKQEPPHVRMPGGLDVRTGAGVTSPTESVVSTKWATAAANEATLDLGSRLPSKEIEGKAVSYAQSLGAASYKIGESESWSLQPKYIDYWADQNPIESASSGDLKEPKSDALGKDLHNQMEGLTMPEGQHLEEDIAFKVLRPDAGKKNLNSNQRTSLVNDEFVSKNAGTMTDLSVKIKDGDGSTAQIGSVAGVRAPSKPSSMNHHSNVAEWTNAKDEVILNGSQKSFCDLNNKTSSVVEQGAALLGSTKELAFVREDAELHVLTGHSRSFNDGEFHKLMTNGETALKHGKLGLFGNVEVGEAETMLYKAADHFASAVALDLSSIEAVGFWGNTLLIHGELKLMLTRELRHLISTPDVISPYWMRQKNGMEAREKSNQAMLQRTFQTVCEECEELLIQAGRKYRRVLSISNSEVRALYNWGLALCFRAQLITEEGGQDACEAADRIYLAAIDKFEAMMGISQRYAPGAMLNWGLTLKDRSRLRPSDSPERISLLQQAKQLFLDALRLQPNDAQIHSAFVTCCVELKELNERQESKSCSRKSFFWK